ncbi:hypothetical protein STEG23_021210, partial [Scotinomys teguina]
CTDYNGNTDHLTTGGSITGCSRSSAENERQEAHTHLQNIEYMAPHLKNDRSGYSPLIFVCVNGSTTQNFLLLSPPSFTRMCFEQAQISPDRNETLVFFSFFYSYYSYVGPFHGVPDFLDILFYDLFGFGVFLDCRIYFLYCLFKHLHEAFFKGVTCGVMVAGCSWVLGGDWDSSQVETDTLWLNSMVENCEDDSARKCLLHRCEDLN